MEQASCYCTTLRKAARRVTAIYDEALAPVGISLAQLSLMRNIARSGSISVSDLGRLMELDRSTVGRNLRVLVRLGMARFTSGDDNREAIVVISDEGYRALDLAEPIWDATQRSIETRVGLKSAEALFEALNQL